MAVGIWGTSPFKGSSWDTDKGSVTTTTGLSALSAWSPNFDECTKDCRFEGGEKDWNENLECYEWITYWLI